MAEALFKEQQVEGIIRNYLQTKGMELTRRNSPTGVDIQGKDGSGNNFFVEVEGNQKPDGRPLDTRQKYTHLLRAIGQICLRMSGTTASYYLGLPIDNYYVKKIKEMEVALKRLEVRVLWVDGGEDVHLTL